MVAGRRRSGRHRAKDQSVGPVVPSTLEKAVAPVPTPPAKSSASNFFWGSQLPRPTFLGPADKSAKEIMTDNRARLDYTSSVQPLMEWAVGASLKEGGVAPKWVGKAPRKPLSPDRLYLEDRRETLLSTDASLRLLTYVEQVRLAIKNSLANGEPQHVSGLPMEKQKEYEQLAAADERRYRVECEEYERLNPGWKAFQERSHTQKGGKKQRSASKPVRPPTAEELFVKEWMEKDGGKEEAEVEGETKEDAACKAWNQLDDEDRAPLLAQAAEAERAYEESLAEWERSRKQRQAERGASAARTSKANKTLRVAKAEPAASGSGFDFASESNSGSESEDEVANARWAKKQSAVSPAAPRTPTGRATRSSTGSVPVSDPKASNQAGHGRATRGARRDGAGATGKAAAGSKPSAKSSAPRTPGGKRGAAEGAPTARKRLRSASPAPPSALQQPPSWPRAATKPEANANAQHRAVLQMQTHPSKRDAAFPRHPEKLVGAKIQEYFADEQNKPKLYRGTVTKFEYERITGQGLTPLWEVRYDDGDCSEKEWHELKDTLSKWPLAGRS